MPPLSSVTTKSTNTSYTHRTIILLNCKTMVQTTVVDKGVTGKHNYVQGHNIAHPWCRPARTVLEKGKRVNLTERRWTFLHWKTLNKVGQFIRKLLFLNFQCWKSCSMKSYTARIITADVCFIFCLWNFKKVTGYMAWLIDTLCRTTQNFLHAISASTWNLVAHLHRRLHTVDSPTDHVSRRISVWLKHGWRKRTSLYSHLCNLLGRSGTLLSCILGSTWTW